MGLLTQLLHLLSPEIAHNFVIRLLRLKQWWDFRILRRSWDAKPSIHLTAIPTLRFASRVGLAAGFDKNAEVFAALSQVGFGFIEVGTVTPIAQPGNPKPRIWRKSPQALVNQLGFNNYGLDVFCANIQRYREHVRSTPLLANIGKGKETPIERAIEDYGKALKQIAGSVDGFVINISSPNTPGLLELQNAEFLETLASLIPANTPAFIKLSPDLENAELLDLTRLVNANTRFSGLVLTNTSPRLAKALGSEVGGLSGDPLFARSVECVALARTVLQAPKVIIGVGGITTLERANQMRAAGADLIEVYTSFIYQGPSWIGRLAAELSSR